MARYRSRISGPLRDRIDLHLDVPAIPYAELAGRPGGESSLAIRERVTRARERQRERHGVRSGVRSVVRDGERRSGRGGVLPTWNGALSPAATARWCRLDHDGARLMEDAADRMGLSARGVHRVLKVARTIADLEGAGRIQEPHLAEAIQYRG